MARYAAALTPLRRSRGVGRTLTAGQRAAAIMSPPGRPKGESLSAQCEGSPVSLIDSAKMNDLDPYVYLKDVLQRLPTHPARRVEELLPHRWRATPPH